MQTYNDLFRVKDVTDDEAVMSKKAAMYRSFYVCDELDCGFAFTNKPFDGWDGSSMLRPVLEAHAFVVALDKFVRVRCVGTGAVGYRRLIDHGMAGYIFPINLCTTPYRVDITVSKAVNTSKHERWLSVVATAKGEQHVSGRKEYELVAADGEVLNRFLCSDEEMATVHRSGFGLRTGLVGGDDSQPGNVWRQSDRSVVAA